MTLAVSMLTALAATTEPTTGPSPAAHDAHAHLVFLKDLAVTLSVAGLVTILFHQLRQPVVLGYILAGVIIGPFTPPFPLVEDTGSIRTLAELGVIFLMFSLGMHFNLHKLVQVGGTAFIAATLEIVLMVWIGYEIGQAFGWTSMDSLFLGAILSISSTTIIVKALADLKLVKERFAELIFGILIVEDMLAIAMIALLSGFASSGSVGWNEVAGTIGRLLVFLTTTLVVGLLIVPRLLKYVARFQSNEMMLVAVLGLCFGVSLLAVMMDYSVALGAFLIGAIIAESREAGRIVTIVEPVRDMFSAIFFVAIGMLIEPRLLVEYAWPILVITLAVVIGKIITCTLGALIAGHPIRTSMRVGMGLAQIGEFSFIIATLGLTLGVTSRFLYPIAVTVSAITTLLTPYLIRASDPLVNWLSRVAPARITRGLETYSSWIEGLRSSQSKANPMRALMRKWTMQIGLNLALMAGIFIFAASMRRMTWWADRLPEWTGGNNAVLWLAAMLLALPLIIATVRKLRAVAMVIGELSVAPRAGKPQQTASMRQAVGNLLTGVFYVLMFIWTMLLSSAVLPPMPMVITLGVVITLVAILRRQHLIRVYARAQIALSETVATASHTHDEPMPVRPMPSLLRDALLRTVEIEPTSFAAGKLIRELQLRTTTGASAVGIEREGSAVINPGPDEELRPGDKVLLLGNEPQLDAATRLLGPQPA